MTTFLHTEADLAAGLKELLKRDRRLIPAAEKAGVQWYFIEDESPISEKQIPKSLEYLKLIK